LKRSIAAVQVDQMMKWALQIFTPGPFMLGPVEDRGFSELVRLFRVSLGSTDPEWTEHTICIRGSEG